MSELLPCPFCGGEAETWDGAGPWHVVCTECGTIGSPCLSEAEAIEAWNSRAERTCEFTPEGMMDDRLWFACSKCGGYITTDYGMPKYCTHCGCKVVGE